MDQVLSGCKYLMEQGIIHRDLKPANILRIGNFHLNQAINGRYLTLVLQSRANMVSRIGLTWEHLYT